MWKLLRQLVQYKEGVRRSLAATLGVAVFALLPVTAGKLAPPAQTAIDPGLRGSPAGAGGFIRGLTTNQQMVEANIKGTFTELNEVSGGPTIKGEGSGAVFDSNSCSSCHAQPAVGGSSSPSNPLFQVYNRLGATNVMPTFETVSGPTIIARFPFQSDLQTPDGSVHQLFTITGRTDAGTCNIAQPDFATAAAQNNLVFRATTPTFGLGLVEIISDSDIITNMNANLTRKQQLGITGHTQTDPDTGSIMRFG